MRLRVDCRTHLIIMENNLISEPIARNSKFFSYGIVACLNALLLILMLIFALNKSTYRALGDGHTPAAVIFAILSACTALALFACMKSWAKTVNVKAPFNLLIIVQSILTICYCLFIFSSPEKFLNNQTITIILVFLFSASLITLLISKFIIGGNLIRAKFTIWGVIKILCAILIIFVFVALFITGEKLLKGKHIELFKIALILFAVISATESVIAAITFFKSK